ncbi:hypothetical protein ACWCOV_13695 [Kribbella sp. NPDC002412]
MKLFVALSVVVWLVLIVILVWGAVDPKGAWWATASQYRYPELHEPSETAYRRSRVGAVIALVIVVAGGIAYWIHLARHWPV